MHRYLQPFTCEVLYLYISAGAENDVDKVEKTRYYSSTGQECYIVKSGQIRACLKIGSNSCTLFFYKYVDTTNVLHFCDVLAVHSCFKLGVARY